MFAALRSTVRRPAHLLRSHSRFGYTRSSLSTQARTSVRGRRLEWSVGAVALVGALAWSNVVHLDAENSKTELRSKSKKAPLTSEGQANKQNEESDSETSFPVAKSPSKNPPPTNQDADDTEHSDDENEDKGGHGGAAYNPETGEINWDCPCLGGMAHGPCGQEFRAAFSCFVYSEEEPKGINCVELFKSMQDCFRAHPDVYGEEIMDDGDDDKQATADAEVDKLENDSVILDTSSSPELVTTSTS